VSGKTIRKFCAKMAFLTNGSPAELAKLNEYLGAHQYIEGFNHTQADNSVFQKVPRDLDAAKYPHVQRWALNIDSFPSRVRSLWAKSKSVQEEKKEEKKAAPAEEKKEGKKEKEGKKDKKQKEKEKEPEPEPEPEAEEEAAPAEEAADDDMGDLEMSFDDLDGVGDADDDEQTRKMFAAKKDLVKDIQARQAANAGNARSNLTLDVKPYDTDTDMAALEARIRTIEIEGMKWLGGQLIDVAYGIKKLRIMCQLVDVLVNVDTVREEVEKFEDEVQSTDVFAFQMA